MWNNPWGCRMHNSCLPGGGWSCPQGQTLEKTKHAYLLLSLGFEWDIWLTEVTVFLSTYPLHWAAPTIIAEHGCVREFSPTQFLAFFRSMGEPTGCKGHSFGHPIIKLSLQIFLCLNRGSQKPCDRPGLHHRLLAVLTWNLSSQPPTALWPKCDTWLWKQPPSSAGRAFVQYVPKVATPKHCHETLLYNHLKAQC